VVAAGGIAEFLDEEGQHLFQHPGIHLGGGMVVHVNGELHALAILAVCLRQSLGDLYFRAH